jgi:hypothetical protein
VPPPTIAAPVTPPAAVRRVGADPEIGRDAIRRHRAKRRAGQRNGRVADARSDRAAASSSTTAFC